MGSFLSGAGSGGGVVPLQVSMETDRLPIKPAQLVQVIGRLFGVL